MHSVNECGMDKLATKVLRIVAELYSCKKRSSYPQHDRDTLLFGVHCTLELVILEFDRNAVFVLVSDTVPETMHVSSHGLDSGWRNE